MSSDSTTEEIFDYIKDLKKGNWIKSLDDLLKDPKNEFHRGITGIIERNFIYPDMTPLEFANLPEPGQKFEVLDTNSNFIYISNLDFEKEYSIGDKIEIFGDIYIIKNLDKTEDGRQELKCELFDIKVDLD